MRNMCSYFTHLSLLTAFFILVSTGHVFAQSPAIQPVKGDTTWMMVSTILVVIMCVPGLALFYGGMVRTKNMLSIFVQVTVIFCIGSVLWALFGYSLAFTDGGGLNTFIGGFEKVFLKGVTSDSVVDTFSEGVVIPEFTFIAFQMTFAGITPALIIGAMAERAKFSAVIWFTSIWLVVVYIPIAHMVWSGGGLVFEMGALDFAGGLVVHLNAGLAGLVCAVMLKKRIGYGRDQLLPHSLTLTMTGAGLLWAGWFGFNAGSNLEATGIAALAIINTLLATAAATLGWLAFEKMFAGKVSALGAASGAISGLVAVTPAAGLAGPMGAILLGGATGIICYFACTKIKHKFGYDDSLDVWGIHGVGGLVGSMGTAVVAAPYFGGAMGMDYDTFAQFIIQIKGTGVTVFWSILASIVIFFVVDKLVGFRVREEAERAGLDQSEHGERAYAY